MWVRYWDESSTCAVLEFKVEEPVVATPVQKEKKEKKKKGEFFMLSCILERKGRPCCSGTRCTY